MSVEIPQNPSSESRSAVSSSNVSAAASASEASGDYGIAIVMVLACLAIILPLIASFNFTARVDWESAINHGDEVRARNVQRGSMKLSVLMFELQRRIFNQKAVRQNMGVFDITQFAPYLMSIFGTEDGAEGIGALVGVDTSALNELSLGPGNSFEVRVEAEGGKVNVNCLYKGVGQRDAETTQKRTVQVLDTLMAPLLFDPLFQEEKADGNVYSRARVIQAMVDYIDDDLKMYDIDRFASSSVGERYRYAELYDPYPARNAKLDSIEELHLIEGIDDDWMAAFSDQLTVYGANDGCKVNLNFASAELIAQVILDTITDASRGNFEADELYIMALRLGNLVVQSREFNLFKTLDEFKEMVAKPDTAIGSNSLFGQSDEEMQERQQQLLGLTGLELEMGGTNSNPRSGSGSESRDPNRLGLKDIATVDPEQVYRIEIISTVGSVNKRLTAVYHISHQHNHDGEKGSWLYIRED